MKIAVFSLNYNFFGEIEKELKKKHELKIYMPTNDQVANEVQIARMVDWADLLVSEFLQSPVDIVIKYNAELNKPHIVRLHRIELFSTLLSSPILKVINCIIYSAEHVKEIYNLRCGHNRPKRQVVIPTNGVDIDLFKFNKREFKKPYRICMVGNILPEKGIYEIVKLMQHLPDFMLTIVGEYARPGYRPYDTIVYYYYIMDLIKKENINNVNLVGSIPHEGANAFFANQDIVISNSMYEGTHVAVAEAMVCGLTPFINNWTGAKDIYPASQIYTSPLELVDKLTAWAGYSQARKINISRTMNEYATKNFDAKKLAVKFRKEIERVHSVAESKEYYNKNIDESIKQKDNNRLKSMKAYLGKHIEPNKQAFDVGCGIGVITEHLGSKLDCQTFGIDLSEKCVLYAQEHHKGKDNVKYICNDFLNVDDAVVDYVIFNDFLEHIPKDKWQDVVLKGLRCCADKFILSAPTKSVDRVQPIDNPIEWDDLVKLIESNDFKIIDKEVYLRSYTRLVAQRKKKIADEKNKRVVF